MKLILKNKHLTPDFLNPEHPQYISLCFVMLVEIIQLDKGGLSSNSITKFYVNKYVMFELLRGSHDFPFPALGPLVETMHNSNHSQTHVSISLPFPYQDIRIIIDDTLDNETIKAE